jgi:hypothetical protein
MVRRGHLAKALTVAFVLDLAHDPSIGAWFCTLLTSQVGPVGTPVSGFWCELSVRIIGRWRWYGSLTHSFSRAAASG